MDLVVDTSALIAVIVGEPERKKIIDFTSGNSLIGPGSIPWEIGNAFSAMFKQDRITLKEAQKGISIFNSIPLRYVEIDFSNVLKLSKEINIYAYDAYFLDCAVRHKAPFLTLDKRLKNAAKSINIGILEI
ncbi:MAG: type II toxin-antitoxin system VapC family toxin [Desulfobacteraceae bacterium]|nr:type II toxin-antitoxin system VapC family toxin [Desulfobacteraceae bacterium]